MTPPPSMLQTLSTIVARLDPASTILIINPRNANVGYVLMRVRPYDNPHTPVGYRVVPIPYDVAKAVTDASARNEVTLSTTLPRTFLIRSTPSKGHPAIKDYTTEEFDHNGWARFSMNTDKIRGIELSTREANEIAFRDVLVPQRGGFQMEWFMRRPPQDFVDIWIWNYLRKNLWPDSSPEVLVPPLIYTNPMKNPLVEAVYGNKAFRVFFRVDRKPKVKNHPSLVQIVRFQPLGRICRRPATEHCPVFAAMMYLGELLGMSALPEFDPANSTGYTLNESGFILPIALADFYEAHYKRERAYAWGNWTIAYALYPDFVPFEDQMTFIRDSVLSFARDMLGYDVDAFSNEEFDAEVTLRRTRAPLVNRCIKEMALNLQGLLPPEVQMACLHSPTRQQVVQAAVDHIRCNMFDDLLNGCSVIKERFETFGDLSKVENWQVSGDKWCWRRINTPADQAQELFYWEQLRKSAEEKLQAPPTAPVVTPPLTAPLAPYNIEDEDENNERFFHNDFVEYIEDSTVQNTTDDQTQDHTESGVVVSESREDSSHSQSEGDLSENVRSDDSDDDYLALRYAPPWDKRFRQVEDEEDPQTPDDYPSAGMDDE